MTMTDDTTTQELLISSDSHVKIEHDNVKQHLATKFHDAYDKAAGGFAAQMSTGAGAVNQAWETSRKHAPDMSAFRLRNTGLLGCAVLGALLHLSNFYYFYGTTLLWKSAIMLFVGAALLPGGVALAKRTAAPGAAA